MSKQEQNKGKDVPFERIRRITGYLTGDTTTWNDAKKAELKQRVKHKQITLCYNLFSKFKITQKGRIYSPFYLRYAS